MVRGRRWILVGLICALLATSPDVWAQFNIEAALAQQDQSVLRYFSTNFVRDHRNDRVFDRIFARLEPHLGEVYSDPEKQVTPYVFISNLGFNAMTWDKIIVFDSLLLDTFHRLAEGVTLYGSTRNQYCYNLAKVVASLSLSAQQLPRLADMNHPDNLYHLPQAGNLTPAEQGAADALFEEMLASWLGHEGSHAFLNHARQRMEAEQMRETAGHDNGTSSALSGYVNRYANYTLGPDKEREADEKGALLITRSGYTIHGFIVSLEFAQYLEELTGVNADNNPSHPPAQERIVDIERMVSPLDGGGVRFR